MIHSNNRIKKLFNIDVPIVQAGMIWCSGWRLASAVSNAGGLGLIGAGSMYPEILREHIHKCKAATTKTVRRKCASALSRDRKVDGDNRGGESS